MIVKNESHIILETLGQLKDLVDYWVICDTGSTDNTRELIADYFSKCNIPGELVQHEWVDFGHNRTRAFQAARGKSKYAFVFDADDKIHGNLVIPKNLSGDAYYLKFGDNFKYTRLQIFRNNLQWVYRGVLHEFPVCISSKKKNNYQRLDGEYHVESRRLGSRNHDPQKYEKDAKVLLDAIESNRDPDLKPRYSFYLAQSYKDSLNYPEAIKFYQMRVGLGGWKEECFYSAWQIGLCMEKSAEKSFSLQEISKWYLKAHEFCAQRGESLFSLGALYYRVSLFGKALFYLNKVSKMRFPEDALFSVRSLYGFDCSYLMCLTLNKLEKFDESCEKCARLLTAIAKAPTANDSNLMFLKNLTTLNLYNSKQAVIPSDFSQYDDFVFYPNKDVFGHDTDYASDLTVPEMIQRARNTAGCNAFNTLGYFKDLSVLCGDAVHMDVDGSYTINTDEAHKIFQSRFINLRDEFQETDCTIAEPTPNRIYNIVPRGIFIKKILN